MWAMEILQESGHISKVGNFDITEDLLLKMIELYNRYSNKSNYKNSLSKNNNFRLARKLAGISLIKLKLSRNIKYNECKEGLLYTIKNPSWPNHVKLGITLDINKRLQAYQTYSPYRDYNLDRYEFVLDRRKTEKLILEQYQLSLEQGEWIKLEDSLEIFNKIRIFW